MATMDNRLSGKVVHAALVSKRGQGKTALGESLCRFLCVVLVALSSLRSISSSALVGPTPNDGFDSSQRAMQAVTGWV